jgi:hypothetical protein
MVKNVFLTRGASMFTGRMSIDKNYLARLVAFLSLIIIAVMLFIFISLQMKKIVSSLGTADYTQASTRT